MSSSSSCAVKTITLKTSEDELFEVEEPVALLSQTIKHVIDDGCADSAIPLQNITGPVLALVIRHCKEQLLKKDDGESEEEHKERVKNRDEEFVKEVVKEDDDDHKMLFDLVMVANYLNITSLLDLVCQAVADIMKGMNVEEMRKMFNIKNDFTDEEFEQVQQENQWAFE